MRTAIFQFSPEEPALSLSNAGGLNLAQDVSPGNTSSNSASPAGTAEMAGNGFSRPYGTRHLSLPNPGLTSWATIFSPKFKERSPVFASKRILHPPASFKEFSLLL